VPVIEAVVAAAVLHAQAPATYREAGAKIQDFVREAIADRFQAGDIPDMNLLRDRSHVYVSKELPSDGVQLTERALPKIPGLRFELISFAELSAMAARTRSDVFYIAVDSPRLEPESATISLGIDFVAASKDTLKMCCCTGHGEFRMTANRWAFVKWTSMTCS
jgi:hypothetical protein